MFLEYLFEMNLFVKVDSKDDDLLLLLTYASSENFYNTNTFLFIITSCGLRSPNLLV